MKPKKSTTNKTSIEKRFKTVRRKVDKANRHVFKHVQQWLVVRRDNLLAVRKNVVIWLAAMMLLIATSIVQTVVYTNDNIAKVPVSGGTYAEGVVDKITTVNPVLASTDSEKALASMVYRGLLTYDESNDLKGDLAKSWSVNSDGRTWTVELNSDLHWSDGQKLTADDVLFTLDLIKNKNFNSPLYSSYETVDARKVNDHTIKFVMPNIYMSFPVALTFGVLPKHILKDKSVAEVNSMSSQMPERIVGSGSFVVDSVENKSSSQSTWSFIPNKNYDGSTPRLDRVTVRTYDNQSAMAAGLQHGEVNVLADVSLGSLNGLSKGRTINYATTADGIYALFNTDGELTDNQEMRNALRLAIDLSSLRKEVVKGVRAISEPRALETPLAAGVYKEADRMKQPNNDSKTANEILDKLGWVKHTGAKYRAKDGKILTINIATLKGTNYERVANIVAERWRNIGVDTKVQIADPATAQQEVLSPRNYDVLIYQLHLGADPDEYAYWSSTQTGATGLNFSNYSSKRAEVLLSNGRTATDPHARKMRYLAFTKQWQQDNPAIALYQPSIYFVADDNVRALPRGSSLVDASHRYRGVENWTVRMGSVKATP